MLFGNAHDDRPPETASVRAATVTGVFNPNDWDIVTADELARTVTDRDGNLVELDDVVVRATRQR